MTCCRTTGEPLALPLLSSSSSRGELVAAVATAAMAEIARTTNRFLFISILLLRLVCQFEVEIAPTYINEISPTQLSRPDNKSPQRSLCYTPPHRKAFFMATSAQEVTELLNQWARGNQTAGEKVLPLIYGELRRIARRSMNRQDPSHTLQTTALVHEAYMRLTGDSGRQWENRAHFFGVAAKAMRHVLVDYARARATDKRGGPHKPLRLEDAGVISGDRMAEVIALDDALTALSKLHARQSQVVELRFFGGCSVEETAETLKISPETVMRDWRAARAWLYRELERRDADEHRNDA